jgi:hypothetical protein
MQLAVAVIVFAPFPVLIALTCQVVGELAKLSWIEAFPEMVAPPPTTCLPAGHDAVE